MRNKLSVRNVLFPVVMCLLLCGPGLLFVAGRMDASLPSWLTAEDATYLSGGIKYPDVVGELSLEGFASGDLQQAIEDEVGNYIPAKGAALLLNAGLQHEAICASNVLFGWDCLPAFYGSSLVVTSTGGGRLLETAEKATPQILENCSSMADLYDQFAERHPELRTFLYFAPDSLNVTGAPTARLVSNPLTYDKVRGVFASKLSSYVWVDGDMPYEEFADRWYKTDHHWTVDGAYDAYRRIAEAMEVGELIEEGEAIVYDQPSFYGSLARRSLNEAFEDRIKDYAFSYPDFEVAIDREESSFESLLHKGRYEQGSWNANKFANRYAEYFHNDFGLIQIDNPEPTVNESLLLVGDSYTNCMERFLASSFATTYVLDPRHDERTIDEFLAEHPDVDNVLFLMRSTNFFSETTRKALS